MRYVISALHNWPAPLGEVKPLRRRWRRVPAVAATEQDDARHEHQQRQPNKRNVIGQPVFRGGADLVQAQHLVLNRAVEEIETTEP